MRGRKNIGGTKRGKRKWPVSEEIAEKSKTIWRKGEKRLELLDQSLSERNLTRAIMVMNLSYLIWFNAF